MAPAGFEPAILASERPKTHALDRASMVLAGACNNTKFCAICSLINSVI
jgi:hypothetical protein